MGAAIGGVDGVGEGVDAFGVGVGVLDRHLNPNIIYLFFNVDRIVQSFAIAVEIADKGGDTTLEVEGILPLLPWSLVDKGDADALGDKGHLPKANQQRVPVKAGDLFENFFI